MKTTAIKSKLFSNVQFVKYDNSGSHHVELINSTNVFDNKKVYSVAELVGSGTPLSNMLQYEAFTVSGFTSKEKFFQNFVLDMKYSENGFLQHYQAFETWNRYLLEVNKYKFTFKVKGENLYQYFYGLDQLMAKKMFKMFVSLKRYDLEDVNNGSVFTVKQIHTTKEDFKSEFLNKDVFFIPDHGKEKTPFEQLDFYKWLDDNKINDHHSINTRKQYLDFIGFDKEIQRLQKDDLQLLKYTLQYHYENKAK